MGIRVLVADCQPLLSECLTVALERFDGLTPITDRSTSGPGAVDAFLRHQPDVALLDYWLPGIDGPEASAEVVRDFGSCKVIFLSWFYATRPWFDAPGDIERVLEAGAVGFLPKHCRVEMVAEAVRRAHAGENPVFPEAIAELIASMRRRREVQDERWQELARLTPREVEVIELLATGMTVHDAADALFLSPATLRTHVQNILTKTGTHTQSAAIATARNYGVIKI